MKKENLKLLVLFCLLLISCRKNDNFVSSGSEWPVLRSYDQEHLYNIALPLGGIGTGTVSLSGRGELIDWEIMNRPAKGFIPAENEMEAPFFSIYARAENEEPITMMVAGPVNEWEYQHMEGRSVAQHGMPRFSRASFDAAYPFGQVHLSDDKMPVDVTIKAFNPISPSEPVVSGLPIAVLNYEVKNKTKKNVVISIAGTMRNFIGIDGNRRSQNWKGESVAYGAKSNRNIIKDLGYIKGIHMISDSVKRDDPAWGSIALAALGENSVTFRTGSAKRDWSNSIADFWNDFSADGELTEKTFPKDDQPMASLAAMDTLEPGETRQFKFILAWHFPNRYDWNGNEKIGNYYTTNFAEAWHVVEDVVPYLDSFEKQSILFVKTLMNSGLPKDVTEAALFNLSTLRSQTVFITPDGKMFGWEGCMNNVGSCWGSCTHVWNYEQATPFLFGSLSRSMREVEFGYATDTTGLMSFRVGLPLKNARNFSKAAADGQMGSIMRFYRDWQLSGDSAFLVKYWPKVRSALAFCWLPGSWDADKDGVMEGIQHNTMDVEYYGPNPQMQFWYLGALRAAEEMAAAMNDSEFRQITHELFLKGSAWTDANLFNGEYYEQIIKVPSESTVSSVFKAGMGSEKSSDPEYQLGKGCLVDQLAGQYMAHLCGLGYLAKKDNIHKALESIRKYNHVEEMNDNFNNMRSFAMGKESGLLMASWPHGKPEIPFPYYAEVMTGFEYTAAAGMFFEGMTDDGLRTINDIRSRYDGLKRNPFNEAECGFHYARAMASWASIIALTEFRYSAVSGTMQIKAGSTGSTFWSTGYAWGDVTVKGSGKTRNITINVFSGKLELKKFILKGFGTRIISEDRPVIINQGENQGFTILRD